MKNRSYSNYFLFSLVHTFLPGKTAVLEYKKSKYLPGLVRCTKSKDNCEFKGTRH